MSVKTIFKEIGAELVLVFGKQLPGGWEGITADLINGLDRAKALLSSPVSATVAALFPNGVGTVVLNDLLAVINDSLPALEVAEGAEAALAGISDATQKADVLIAYILDNISKLPASWQGKHWLDVAKTILVAILGITETEANALINTKLGQLQAVSGK
jgi:hypothetical protein